MSREAMQRALIALDGLLGFASDAHEETSELIDEAEKVILELKAELAKPEQEPVAWVDVKDSEEGPCNFFGIEKLPAGKHDLYAAPLNLNDKAVQKRLAAQWGYVPRCEHCDGNIDV